MEEAANLVEIVAQQLASAWELSEEQVLVDVPSERKPATNFAALTPSVEFGPSNSCNQQVSLSVDVGARFPLVPGTSAFRQRAARVEQARKKLVYAAQSNPGIPRIGDRSNVTTGSLDDPADGVNDPGNYLVTITFETVFFIDTGTGLI